MKKIVADSSALILLAKCNLLERLSTLGTLVIPQSVFDETASEKHAARYPDANIIADLVLKGLLRIEKTSAEKPNIPLTLGRGEYDALILARALPDSLFATDDGKAIKAAKFLKVPFIITPKIVIELFRLKMISIEKARSAIEKLSIIGRYPPEIIAEALLALLEATNGKTDDCKDT